MLSLITLDRLLPTSESHLQDWQAGFRRGRGCRDNTAILRTLCDRILRLGESIVISFIDYSTAFDSVSHKFLDEALIEAGASNKLRAIFRAVYLSASAFTSVTAPEGKTVKSGVFPVRRGVIQGDTMSPLYFILALDLILRRHDQRTDKGALGQTVIHTLGYADDATLIDRGDAQGVQLASERLTDISKGSRTDADMDISIRKTKGMHVRAQDKVSATTAGEACAACKFICPHPHCGYKFYSKRGM